MLKNCAASARLGCKFLLGVFLGYAMDTGLYEIHVSTINKKTWHIVNLECGAKGRTNKEPIEHGFMVVQFEMLGDQFGIGSDVPICGYCMKSLVFLFNHDKPTFESLFTTA